METDKLDPNECISTKVMEDTFDIKPQLPDEDMVFDKFWKNP